MNQTGLDACNGDMVMPNRIPTTTELTAFWDAAATSKSFGHPLPPSVLDQFRKPGRVLDFGCGTGRLTTELAAARFEVSGTDSSPAMLSAAQSALPNCEFRVYDGELPWADDHFDAVILVTLLTSVPNRADQARVVTETSRVTKPGGHVFVSDLPVQWSQRYVARYESGMKKFGDFGVFELPNGGVVRHHELHYFLQLMSRFRTLLIEPHEVTTMNGNQATAIRYLGQL